MLNLNQATAIARQWAEAPFDAETRQSVAKWLAEGDEQQILKRFGREMEFGTAGLRGIMGPGTFYMNQYSVARSTRGLADCLNALYPQAKSAGVVVGYDCRHNSEGFAAVTAGVLAAAGIKVYLYDRLTPTPLVPFAVRRLKAQCGIMITSSHNPKQYNGYKVFWENGAQIIAPLDKEISAYIEKVPGYTGIETLSIEEGVQQGLIRMLGAEETGAYTDWAAATATLRDVQDACILYTPLHGTGYPFVSETFGKIGFSDFHVVPEQRDPDGAFPTVSAPNPEKPDAFDLALQQAAALNADLIIATDGDSDRIGSVVRRADGSYQVLNGNQIATLLLYYILGFYKDENKIKKSQFAVCSVVSSPLTARICAYYGIGFRQTLTGFKWMGNVAEQLVQDGGEFVLAFEEAFGVTFGDSRDKDGVTAIALISEAVAWYKQQGRTLLDLLDEIYLNCGLHLEGAAEKVYDGADGRERMNGVMDRLRRRPPETVNGSRVVRFDDILNGTSLLNGKQTAPVDLPAQNLLIFTLEDDSWIAVRPSGTEPKIKAYLGIVQLVSAADLQEQKKIQADKVQALEAAARQMLE